MITTNRTLRACVIGVAAVLAVGPLAACGSGEEAPPANSAPVIVPGKPGEEASTIAPGEATQPPDAEPNDADQKFVEDMIVHHQQAVWMTSLAPERASSRDVKEMASRISDVQTPEIEMLNRWLSQHAIPTVDPTVPHGHGDAHGRMPGMASDAQLEELKGARGQAFDQLFLQLMITHHEGALAMAEEVRKGGVDVRVQEIADDITAEQTDEVRRMRGWLTG